jgi:hypothetical protein
VSALVLACGDTPGHGGLAALTERDDVEIGNLPAKPGRTDVDPLLTALAGRRLVVVGTDADLAAVVLRLMRRELLEEVTVGFVATERDSWVAELWGLPGDFGRMADVALRAEADPVPLIRDDAGGVLVGLGRVGPTRGVGYCDDTTALRGRASAIEVTPDPDRGLGLIVRVIQRGVLGKRVSTFKGRALQLGTLPITPVKDGQQHPRPTSRWTWYRHTADLRVARGMV